MPRKKKEKPVLDPEIYTRTGKLRKRKPKRSRNYFTEETEDAIIKFVQTDDQNLKNKLFNEYINYSIHKLAENIINTFKFPYTDVDNIEHLKHEVVIFLLERFYLYKKTNGKAYSYFGTIAKRYLITYNKNNYKKIIERKELTDVDSDKMIITEQQNEKKTSEISHFIESYIKFVENNIERYFITSEEKTVVFSILKLFKNRETLADLNVFNKQVCYLQIREETSQNTQFITKVVKILKMLYKQQANIYYLKGGLDIEEDDIYS